MLGRLSCLEVSPACKVFEYEGDFYGQRAWFKVTSCAGGSLRAKLWNQLDAIWLFAG